MKFWNYNYLEARLSNISYYTIGPNVLKFNHSRLTDLTFYLKSICHLEIKNIDLIFDFQLYFIETSFTEIKIPYTLYSWENIDPYNGKFIGLPNGYVGVKNTKENSLIWIDKYEKKIVFAIQDIKRISLNEQVAPLRSILHLWFEDSKFFMCHAAGIAQDDQGVLLTAKGGSGKSTSALASVKYGLGYAGDDFLLVDSEECVAYSLYNVAKLELPQFDMFEELKPFIENRENTPKEKGQIFLTKIYPNQICLQFKIKSILVPIFSKLDSTSIKKCSKSEAIKALVPSSIWIMRGSTTSANKMISFIHKIDCYSLNTGTDLKQIPAKIKDFINEN